MNPSNFMLGIGEAIGNDAELQAWCQEIFKKPLTVFVGVDVDNPPDISDYPVCALLEVTERRGEAQRATTFSLDLSVAVYDEEVKTSGNLRIFSGLPKAAELKHRVEGAILRSGLVASVDFPESDGVFAMSPIFVGFSMAECQIFKSSRQAMRR